MSSNAPAPCRARTALVAKHQAAAHRQDARRNLLAASRAIRDAGWDQFLVGVSCDRNAGMERPRGPLEGSRPRLATGRSPAIADQRPRSSGPVAVTYAPAAAHKLAITWTFHTKNEAPPVPL